MNAAKEFTAPPCASGGAYRENKPGQWKPTAEPYRVSFITKTGRRYDAYRITVYTFATEREARECMATLADKRPRLDVAMNAATWRDNGYWRALSGPSVP